MERWKQTIPEEGIAPVFIADATEGILTGSMSDSVGGCNRRGEFTRTPVFSTSSARDGSVDFATAEARALADLPRRGAF
jgi:hypothetical protein